MPTEPFRTCPKCKLPWLDRSSFLADPSIRLIGYQSCFIDLESGLFLFNHTVSSCGTTIGIPASDFTDLHTGPVFEARLTGAPGCTGHCLRQNDLDPCPEACECRYVRDVMLVIRDWPKRHPNGHPCERLTGRCQPQGGALLK